MLGIFFLSLLFLCIVFVEQWLELELDASVNPSHPTDDIGKKAKAYI